MTEAEYQQWWQLHLRVAEGKILNAAEQAAYQAGLDALDQEEAALFSTKGVEALRRLRAQVQTLTQTQRRLAAYSTQLDQQIVIRERLYQQLTGYELALEANAAS